MNRWADKLFRGHNTLWLIVAVITLQVALFWGTVIDMSSLWRVSVFRHCWVIVPLAVILAAQRSPDVERAPFSFSPLAFVLLPLLAAVWFVGERASVRALEHLAFAAIVVASILAVIGWRKFRLILFPMLLLFAAVPIGDFMIPTLMEWTADIAAGLLELTGVPAWRQGALITLPNGVFHVAEVCSGISYLLAGLILSLVYANLVYRKLWKRAVFVAVTVVSFIALNGLRAFIVMIVANATDMRWFTGWDHIYFGQFLFFCLAVALFVVGERFSDAPPAAVGHATGGQTVMPFGLIGVRMVLTVGLSFGVLQVAWLALSQQQGAAKPPVITLRIADCGESQPWAETFVPALPGARDAAGQSYRCDADGVGHFIASFDDPQAGSELVNQQHRYWPDTWDDRGIHDDFDANLRENTLTVGELFFEQAGRTRIVWYVYTIGDHVTHDPYAAKFWEALYGVMGKKWTGELHLITADVEGDRLAARETLESYLVLER